MQNTVNILLSHQPPEQVARTITAWEAVCERENLLLAYGGPEAAFPGIDHEPKLFISDARLRTRGHQRERQSYAGIFRAAAAWLARNRPQVAFVHFAEFDHLPLVPDLNQRQTVRLAETRADLLGYHLRRVDGTNDPHFLYHTAAPEFSQFLRRISVRKDPSVVLTMLITGAFWRRTAFEAAAAVEESTPIYLELAVPTIAHHLGFRVGDFGAQNAFVCSSGERSGELTSASSRGAWTLHPVKTLNAATLATVREAQASHRPAAVSS